MKINNEINNYIILDNYIKLLQDKKTICIKDYKKHNNGILVRHDVDFSLDLAYEFSRYEKTYNINSTYYLLISSDAYNIFSQTSRNKILEMIEDGFEIGLHFDPSIYGDLNEQELINKMSIEIEIFERYFNYKIYSYSMHNPSISGVYIDYQNLINAYDSAIFTDDNYISDSSYSFRGKNPKSYLAKSEIQLMQFLTHPIHFFGDGTVKYEKQLNDILNSYYQKLDDVWIANKVYSSTKNEYTIKIIK
jgi:hypothetical protein